MSMCLAKGIYVRFTTKRNIGSKGKQRIKHVHQGRQFDYVAQNIQRNNASIISSIMNLLMRF